MKRIINHRGVTLIETTITIAFLGITIVPLTMMYNTNYLAGDDASHILIGTNLAQDLMEEIRGKNFEETSGSFGNESGEVSGYNRTAFDDVDDYDIYTTWGAQSPPRDIDGSQLTDFSGFSRKVTVINIKDVSTVIPRTDFSAQGDGTTDFKLISVTVTWDKGNQSTALKYIAAK